MIDLLAEKRQGKPHTAEQLRYLAQAAAAGGVPDYQLSAWLMSVCCRGMTEAETVALTRAMGESGQRFDLSALRAPKVDKHSTGGVGDGISLALAPLIAEAGLVVPMMSGRGLGHTGGTLDKLESIAGLRVKLSLEEIKAQLSSIGVCMFGQSESLAPADRKLYALRDATSTVESQPLIVSSILSKKVAEDLDALVLDVKVGSGAIFQDRLAAERLARALVKTAKGLGIECVAVLTDMEQPLGRYVGNALEIRQAVEILQGRGRASDYAEVLLTLGGWMLHLAGKAGSPGEGADRLEGLIRDGRALSRFKKMVQAQGGDARLIDEPDRLPLSPLSRAIKSPRDGCVARLDARRVGQAAVRLGAGRETAEQRLDYGAGLVLERKLGERVKKGETLATLYAGDRGRLDAAAKDFLAAVEISPRAPHPRPVIIKTLK